MPAAEICAIVSGALPLASDFTSSVLYDLGRGGKSKEWPSTAVARPESADAQLVALKVPPHSIEAEQALLGALLIDNQAFDKIGDLLTGEDFYRDDHRRIWRTSSRWWRTTSRRTSSPSPTRSSAAKTRTRPAAPPTSRRSRKTPQRDQRQALRAAGARCSCRPARPGRHGDRRKRARAGRQGSRPAAGRGRVEDLPDRRVGHPQGSGPARIKPVLARVFEKSITSTARPIRPTSPGADRLPQAR